MDRQKPSLLSAVAAFAAILIFCALLGLPAWWKHREEGPPADGAQSATGRPGAEAPAQDTDGPPSAPDPTGPPATGLRERSSSPWRVKEAEYRQIVEIPLRPLKQPSRELRASAGPPVPLMARCGIALGEPTEALATGGDPGGLRVFDARGRELGAKLAPVGDAGTFELVFEAPGGGADGPFEVYYPAPGGKALPALGPEKGITLAVYRLKTHSTEGIQQISDVARLVKGAVAIERPRRRAQIDDCKLPFDRHDFYVALYQGYLACPVKGLYAFGLDADDRAFLAIDGKAVVAGGAPNKLPKTPFPYRSSTSLSAGLHALALYHVQGSGAIRARLAWRPPGSKHMRVIPPSAFVWHLPAKAVALERRERESVEPFFAARLRRRIVANRSVPVTEWELVASGPTVADAVRAPQEPASADPVYRETGGLCVMEAERFTGIDKRSDVASWSVAKEHGGFSGTGYAWTGEEGAGERPTWRDTCEITFRIDISTPGEYHIAWRHLSPDDDSNSVWTGLDGEDRSQAVGFHQRLSERWTWQRGTKALGRLDAGVHTVHLRRREDGFSIDRLAIATDPDRLPENNSREPGPPESPRAEGPARAAAQGGGEGGEGGGAVPPLRWVWREGELILGRSERLRLFVSGFDYAEAGVRPWREITLSLLGRSGELARYVRRVGPKPHDPLEDEEISFRIEAGAAPSFIYPSEPFEIHLRAVNDSTEPVGLEVAESRLERSAKTPKVRRLGRFELPAVGPSASDVIARRMNRIRRRFEPGECERIERLVYFLGPPGAPAPSLAYELIDSRARTVPDLRAEAGAFVIAGVVFVMPYDSESELRRWALFRTVSFGGKDRGEALLYGDPLASPGAVEGEGLAPRMRDALPGVNLRVAFFPPGAWPVHAAAAGASAELSLKKWGRVWISLGTLDMRAGTPLREYERGIDLLIDRAWSLAPRSRLVLVGPPPEPGRRDVSGRYAEAARIIAQRHHIEFVDLYELVTSLEDPDAAYRERGPDDGVRFPYPLGEAMDDIARAVLGN